MQANSITRYYDLVKSGLEEPLTTHADHFNTNYAYSMACLFKGVFLLSSLVILLVLMYGIKFYWNIIGYGVLNIQTQMILSGCGKSKRNKIRLV